MKSQPLLFLDRDGVINIDSGYVHKWEDFILVDGVVESLIALQNLGFLLVIVTNQSGIGRGFYTEAEFKLFMDRVVSYLKSCDVVISGYYYCPHYVNSIYTIYARECDCRKPNIGMINRALAELNGDRKNSIMIGDRETDIIAGYNAGLKNSYLISASQPWPALVAEISKLVLVEE